MISGLIGSYIRSRIYLPEPFDARSGLYGDVAFERITTQTADGLDLAGLRNASVNPPRYTMLFLHGNGGCAATRAGLVAPLCQAGADVIVADYRGYGTNPGRPTEEGLMADARTFADLALRTSDGPTILFGHSLGGAIAIRMQAEEGAGFDGLITLGAFARLDWFVPVFARRFLPDRFSAIEVANRIAKPWMLLHEVRDDVVPFRHGQALFAAVQGNSNVEFSALEGGDHALDAAKLGRAVDAVLARCAGTPLSNAI
ncbi:alpha/beta hydrolase [Oceaniradius stylonematis]|uniref:alpha/beta hydrolase n=1 Tax=Oceaniradius stylonematis TaxID=2184161 RepID=UPI003C7A8B3D